MSKKLKECPFCKSTLEITEYHCPDCDISIKGKFEEEGFSQLTAEQWEFLKVYVCCDGYKIEIADRLKISESSVKAKLAEITKIFNPQPQKKPERSPAMNESRNVLDELSNRKQEIVLNELRDLDDDE